MHLGDILGLLPNCWGPLSLRFRGSMHFGKYRKTVPSFNSPTEQVYLIHQMLAFLESQAEKPWFSRKLWKEQNPKDFLFATEARIIREAPVLITQFYF